MHRDSLTSPVVDHSTNSHTFIDYLEIVAKNRLIIWRITLAAFVISTIISLLLPKIYVSTARILPPQQDNSLLGLMMGQAGGGVASLASDILGKGTSSDLYASILTSEAIKDKIIDRFNLINVYGNKYRLDTYKSIDKRVVIDVGKKDGIISITVEDKSPKRAAAMANAYIDELGALMVDMNTSGASQNRKFLEQRLGKAKMDLAFAEDALKTFQFKNRAPDITEQAKGTIQGIADIMGQLTLEEVKLSTLQQQYTDSSQEVITQKNVIKNLKSQIAHLEGDNSRGAIPGLGSVPALGEQYVRLMREFKIQETLVELLTKQYELAKFNEADSVTSLQVIQRATLPDKKTKPKRSLLILGSTFIGLMFSIMYVFVLEYVSKLPADEKNRWQNAISALAFRKQFTEDGK